MRSDSGIRYSGRRRGSERALRAGVLIQAFSGISLQGSQLAGILIGAYKRNMRRVNRQATERPL
jgi:hypothetical protein